MTVIAAIARKDLSIWLHRPVAILTTLTPSIMYVIVVYYISISVGTPPIAVVAPHPGPESSGLVNSLRDSGGFSVDVVSAARAKAELRQMKVAAVVTVPSSLRRPKGSYAPLRLPIEVNNLNEDIRNDVRRSLALSINTFARGEGATAAVAVDVRTTHATDVSLAQFRLLPGLVLILTIAGIVNTGLATCQEFEGATFKDLVLAPTPTWTLAAGKIIGGWLTTLMIAAVMWAIGLTTGLISPAGPYLLPAVAVSALVGLAASCIGVAMGAALRQFQLVTSLSVMVALYLFFLAGGVAVPAFLPGWLHAAGAFDPLHYAIDALEHTVLDSSLADYGSDLVIVIAFALAAAALSTLVLRQRADGQR